MRRSRRSLMLAAGAIIGLLAVGPASPALADENEATFFHRYGCEREKATLAAIPEQKIVGAWNQHDADQFAGLFAEDASLILPSADIYMKNRDQIRAMMARGFSGPFRETRLAQKALDVKCVDRRVAVVITQGGIMFPGETEVNPSRVARETYTIVRTTRGWSITAYHNSRIS
jgi:uncharacterized protein (TIGR02246 family)